MILALFYTESLRKTIIECVTNDVFDSKPKSKILRSGTKNALKKALDILVKDCVFSSSEREEIEKLIDYRNDIAHRLEELVGDISHPLTVDYFQFRKVRGIPEYDYHAVEKLRTYRELLFERGRNKYVWQISLNPLLFFGAEQALQTGLKRLKRTINKQMKQRKAEMKKLNSELSLEGMGFDGVLHPYHPDNKYDSGRLTSRGVEVCYRLFDAGKSPLAVSYFMRLSLGAVKKRYKMWEDIGGKNRRNIDFDGLPVRKY